MPDPTDAMRRAATEWTHKHCRRKPGIKAAHLAGQQQGRADAVEKIEALIAKMASEIQAKLDRGKGTWPNDDYIKDEIWHQWQGELFALHVLANAIARGEWLPPDKAFRRHSEGIPKAFRSDSAFNSRRG